MFLALLMSATILLLVHNDSEMHTQVMDLTGCDDIKPHSLMTSSDLDNEFAPVPVTCKFIQI